VKSSPHHALPIFTVDRSAASPLHKQIYQGYREAILRGDLRPGDRISSSREFAVELGISRFPVLNGYAQLHAEGYLESRIGAGTFVSSSLPEQLMSVTQPDGQTPPSPSGPAQWPADPLFIPPFHSRPGHVAGDPLAFISLRSIIFLSKSGPASSAVTVETLLPAPSIRSIPAAARDSARPSATICERLEE